MKHEYDDEMRDRVCEALVRRGRTLAAEVKKMNEEIQTILSRLDDLTPLGWELNVDGIPARKKLGNRAFSPELAVARFTEEELAFCKAEGLDPKKIAELAKAKGIKEACMVQPDESKAGVKLVP